MMSRAALVLLALAVSFGCFCRATSREAEKAAVQQDRKEKFRESQ